MPNAVEQSSCPPLKPLSAIGDAPPQGTAVATQLIHPVKPLRHGCQQSGSKRDHGRQDPDELPIQRVAQIALIESELRLAVFQMTKLSLHDCHPLLKIADAP